MGMKDAVKRILFILALTWFALVIPRGADAQEILQAARAEIEAKTFSDNYEVIPFADSTLIVYKSPYYEFFKPRHSFKRYDQNLKQLWEITIELDDYLDLHQIYPTDKFLYILYLDRNPMRFHLLQLDTRTSEHTITRYNLKDFDLDSDTRLDEFKVVGDKVFITAHNNRNFLVLHLNLQAKEIKPIPALYDQLSALADFHLDTVANRAEFILAESNGPRGRLQAKRFSLEGNLYTTNFIQPDFKKNLITARFTPGDSASKRLIGAFSTRDLRFAQGLFTAPLTGGKDSIVYYDFLELKHFFDFLSKGAQRRLQQRADRYKQRNKELRLSYRVMLHDLQAYRDTLYLFAEVYTVSQNTNQINRYLTRSPYYPYLNGVYLPNQTPPEAQTKYSHSLVVAFDRNGKLLWDNAYVLEDAITNELAQLTQPAFAGDKIILAYAYKKDIRYKVIDRDLPSDNELSVPVLTYSDEEKVTSSDHADLQYWYGSNYVAFGFQHIREPGYPSREVFYLNKVTFRDADSR
jgi:hypothetical protein